MRPSAGIGVVEVQKLEVFCVFVRARATQSSAGIGVVEVQKLEVFAFFCGARAALCGDRRELEVFGVFGIPDEPSAEIVRVEALSLWRRAILAFGSCLVVCAPAFAIPRLRVRFPLVRGSSGLKIAAFQYNRSTRSVLMQLRLENRNF